MITTEYSFDDILIIPDYCDFDLKEVDLSARIATKKILKYPLISSAMDTITNGEMARAMELSGCMGVIHRNQTIEEQINQAQAAEFKAVAIGSTGNVEDNLKKYKDAGVDMVFVDAAHGDSKNVVEATKLARKYFDDVCAGNVVTGTGALRLLDAGATAVKVGVGPGSICTTRIVSGCGRPQLSALDDVANKLEGRAIIIADGGIRSSGDIVKALLFGANFVMIGNLLAGAVETPGDVLWNDGFAYKTYRGMGSKDVIVNSDRYMGKMMPEGVSTTVDCKGYVRDIIPEMVAGVVAGFGYAGCKHARDLSDSKYVIVSPAGIQESHPHIFDKIR